LAVTNGSLVDIVIPNWNGSRWLQQCLPSIFAQSFRDFEVILVDNGSTDESVDWVRAQFPRVQIIRNKQNLGFGAATNQGIIATCSPYVATLNNDTQVAATWLESLVQAAERDPGVGMWASKMVYAEHPETIDSTGICLDKCGVAWDRLGGEPDRAYADEPREIFGPCGGAALYSRELLDNVGLIDEDFFAYLEDVDLAWRARLAGWRCQYVPTAVVHHYHSATSRHVPSRKWRLLGRNKIAMILKNYPSPQLYRYASIIFAYDVCIALLGLLVRGDASHILGRLEGAMKWRFWWHKRKSVQARRTITADDWDKIVSPVVGLRTMRRRLLSLPSIDLSQSPS
jgi:GT2 family glycosyltransferase